MKRYCITRDGCLSETQSTEAGIVYRASDVDELLERIDVEARQQSAFTMANIRKLITNARLGLPL